MDFGQKKFFVKLIYLISWVFFWPRLFLNFLVHWVSNQNRFTATARLFQLDGLIDQCETILEETINIETVIKYYDAATMYASFPVQNACLKWLRVNLLSHLPEHPTKLRWICLIKFTCVFTEKFCEMHYFFNNLDWFPPMLWNNSSRIRAWW